MPRILQMHDSIKFWAPLCTLSTRVCNGLGWGWVCAIGVQVCQMTEFVPIMAANPGINVYDITKKCEGPLCYDFTNADK
jgi:vitellogenic carboxypeptidase-like protein/serine carboxypeptidase-like clade 4